jgi:hypothetical protein
MKDLSLGLTTERLYKQAEGLRHLLQASTGRCTSYKRLPLTIATKTSTTTDYYTAKAGRIAIFNGDNYPDFRRTCQAALIIVSAWNFIDGQEDPVTARTADAVKCRAEGIKLIFNSLGETYQESITEQMAAQNPRLMWEEIAKYDRARDDGYVGEIHEQF